MEQGARKLEKWLSGRLTNDHSEILRKWCKHWEDKVDGAENNQEQRIFKSLFIQSARRLHSLQSISLPSVEAIATIQHPEDPQFTAPLEELYMGTDMFNSMQLTRLELSRTQGFLAYLRPLPAYQGLEYANAQLKRLIRTSTCNDALKDLLQALSDARMSALCDTSTSGTFGTLFFGILALPVYTLRVHVLIMGRRKTLQMARTTSRAATGMSFSRKNLLLRSNLQIGRFGHY